MIQKKYLCRDIETAENAVGQIADILSATRHNSALVTFYEKGFTKNEIDSLIDKIKGCGFPELKVAGISLTMVAEFMPEGGEGILLNLVVTEESGIEVIQLPCVPGGEEEAAGILKDRLDSIDNVKAVELFGSNMELNTTLFMEKGMEGHESAPLFGTTTLRNLTQRVSVDEGDSPVDVEKVDAIGFNDEFIAGDSVILDGFVAVVFFGEKLTVQANYALGWEPIGRRLSVKLGDNPVKGETLITQVNSLPAVDIYREYLGVYPDEHFIANICEFPFVVERDGINICLIPIDHGKDGELSFMMTVKPDEKLRFSFASHDEVLFASLTSLYKMEEFRPEALFLTLCGNRINFLKEDAHMEWDGFSKTTPDYALMHGACELYYHDGKGGILNSAHLSVGMRESEEISERSFHVHPTIDSLRHGRVLSLSDRMSTFLSKITNELIETADQAQKANTAKSAFLSHMSHEIRTPINAILGMDEMIIKESKEKNTLDYADSIRSAGNNLLGIVNDILDFSKIEAGKMSIVPTGYELASVVKDMYNVVRLRAEDKGLKVMLDIDPTLPSVLFGDSSRIKQVITNILTNAVKYTEKGSVTFIMKKIGEQNYPFTENVDEIHKACPDEAFLPDKVVRISISVKDTGIGIKPEDINRLFDEYSRFDEKRNRSVEGTGLGMSITGTLLELMGSSLIVKSTYGEGSEFGFEIMQGVVKDDPFGDVEKRLKKQPVKKKSFNFTAEDARILAVDDTKINLTILTKLLKNTKLQIDTAESGAEALRLVQENEYDLIFLDHLMPDLDGPETLRRMNELENNKSAGKPVISLTSNVIKNAKEEYRKLGYDDYLSKPFHLEELGEMIIYYVSPEKIRTVDNIEE